jgi:hypothetical protein
VTLTFVHSDDRDAALAMRHRGDPRDRDDTHGAPNDEPQHVARRRTERASHANIAHAVLDGVREDTKHDRRQQERQRGEVITSSSG